MYVASSHIMQSHFFMYIQVSCAVQRRTSRRSKPNWDLVRKSGEYQSPTPAPSDNGSSYGSSYEPSYGNGNGSSSSSSTYNPPAPAYSPPEPEPAPSPPPREVRVEPQTLRRSSSPTKSSSQKGRWRGMDAGVDQSDDQVRLQSRPFVARAVPILAVAIGLDPVIQIL